MKSSNCLAFQIRKVYLLSTERTSSSDAFVVVFSPLLNPSPNPAQDSVQTVFLDLDSLHSGLSHPVDPLILILTVYLFRPQRRIHHNWRLPTIHLASVDMDQFFTISNLRTRIISSLLPNPYLHIGGFLVRNLLRTVVSWV